ncbi:hemagglutinin repeat-containing protein [Paraburkholderia sacchari]|uniref:hemagglutinin repeat-containing protein n=1 Tax=Paraburkholderia sacchari TaxID=159450 RepID=UPI003B8A77A9
MSGKEAASSNNSTAILSQRNLVCADSVSIASGPDINVAVSTIVSANDVSLSAAHNVSITTTQDTRRSPGTHREIWRCTRPLASRSRGIRVGRIAPDCTLRAAR